jgi:excinuclease ABC subunit C
MPSAETDKISLLLRSLPDKPGVYQFYDKEGKILYIGKAKSLKKRVSSYFNKEQSSGKLTVLVRKIADIRHIVVDSETDALLLENNLIKKYQPRYNVMLKDDKTYPWIIIKNEPFARVFYTRNKVRDNSEYFGPYASGKMMHALLDLVRHIYPLRNCSLRLSKTNIHQKKFKVCLEYHLGNCLGPCEGRQDEENYRASLVGVREIIKGNFSGVLHDLRQQMNLHATLFEFEQAQGIKEKIEQLERYQARSTVVNTKISNVDVFSIITDEESGYVNYVKVVSGAIIQAYTVEIRKKLDESPQELLSRVVVDLRDRLQSDSPEIIVPFDLDIILQDVVITVPKIGDKKHLLELSEKNARYYRIEKEKQVELVDPEKNTRRILERMMADLRMNELPRHIECFDNSNFQGTDAVSAMVCFKNAKPEKKEYRHYIIRTVEGPNDFASMEEVIVRRYKRLMEENKPLPQLIVVDGGKGQLSAALKSLESLGLRGKITIIGIAKKLEEIYYPGDSLPMYLDKKSETLKVLQRLRDEAHRFGITHHRKRRDKNTLKTDLTGIPGIGDHTAKKLLSAFKSVKKIQEASRKDIEVVIGKAKAKIVFDYLLKSKTEEGPSLRSG